MPYFILFYLFHLLFFNWADKGAMSMSMSMSAGVLVLNANLALKGRPAMSDLVSVRRKLIISASCNKLQKIP
jgi:hypothetical protein